MYTLGMEKTRKLKTDPATKDVRLEITKTVDVMEVLDEKRLKNRKAYLEKVIAFFMADLAKVDSQLQEINTAKNG